MLVLGFLQGDFGHFPTTFSPTMLQREREGTVHKGIVQQLYVDLHVVLQCNSMTFGNPH